MAAESSVIPLGQRLERLMDRLGLAKAHFCLRQLAELVDLGDRASGRIASIIVQGVWGAPADLAPFLDRTLWILGDEGAAARQFLSSLAGLSGARAHLLKGYPDLGWSDSVSDRTGEIAAALLRFLDERDNAEPQPSVTLSGEGEVDEITYRAAGSGTPVVLLPLGLSAHQWDAVLPALQARHCTIVLGGRHLSPVSLLENRAAGDYSHMALDMLDRAALRAAQSLIEIGCGSGALLRRIAQRTGLRRVAGLDVNPFLLREARALAAAEGALGRLELHEGSAESIPLPDNTFDTVFSSTMLEEGDAGRMLSEMVRIAKPGGSVVVIVRSVDLPKWTNLPLPEPLRQKVTTPSGPVTEKGCADGSLIQRLFDAGLTDVRGGPAWAWIYRDDPFWQYTDSTVRMMLEAGDVQAWHAALAAANTAGAPIAFAQPFHCASGKK